LVFGLDEAGQSRQSLLITALAEDGPAQRAGIQAGDVIITIDGEPISDGREAMHRIARMRPGEGLSVGVVREDQMLSLNAVVGTRASVN
jgi:serine protease DegS